MKKIGFVDYYLSEWHADHYPAWISALGREYEVAYAWAEREVSPRDGITTAEWCEKMGISALDTIEELCEKSDAIIILAPSDPDRHLPYAKRVLPYGKPTYIDKTFAPNEAEAREIVSLADEYGTPFFSTSALRYASELDLVKNPRVAMVAAGGLNTPEYIIHPLEMVAVALGTDAEWVRADATQSEKSWHVAYPDGKYATLLYADPLPNLLYLSDGCGNEKYAEVVSPFFSRLMSAILDLFDSGDPAVKAEETLGVMRLRDALLASLDCPGEKVFLAK